MLFELFCYIFSLTAFSHSHRLRLDRAAQVFDPPFLQDMYYRGYLLGQSRDIFFTILRMSTITKGTGPQGHFDSSTTSELIGIEAISADWNTSHPRAPGTIMTDADITSELYRLSCLIRVRNLLNRNLSCHDAEIRGLVSGFITNLDLLQPTSPANGILCWPLFVAGALVGIATHQRLIVGRLQANNNMWRTEILSKAANFLTNKWKTERSIGQDSIASSAHSSRSPPLLGHDPNLDAGVFEHALLLL